MDWLVLLTFVISLGSSVFSGMSGGGAGFITVPYLLFIGMPPANVMATTKIGAVGTTSGALAAFKGQGLIKKQLLLPLMSITLACALVSAWLIPQIDPGLFQKVIGIMLIVLIPTLFINKKSLQPGPRTKPWLIAGYAAYILFAFLQTLIGSGVGSVLVIVLMLLFGLNALEANATKRVTQSVQAIVLMILLGLQGLIVWSHGIACVLGGAIGTHIGTKIAINKGVGFVKVVLAITMAVSGIALVLT